MQRMGSISDDLACFTFSAIMSSVSANFSRLSEWPTIDMVTSSLRSSAGSSPVNEPVPKGDRSWEPKIIG